MEKVLDHFLLFSISKTSVQKKYILSPAKFSLDEFNSQATQSPAKIGNRKNKIK